MGQLHPPPRVTPLVALLARDPAHMDAVRAPLEAMLGPIELESELFPFARTAYYTQSMGEGLKRRFLAFRRLADADRLADWKLATNALEADFAARLAGPGQPARPVNVDPGYLLGGKLVLASTKDFAHRIYLRDGIFAEITMVYSAERWVSHAFTFPDFKSGTYDHFLKRVRDRHLRWIKEERRNATSPD